MRRWSLALLVSLASPALAQAPAAPAPEAPRPAAPTPRAPAAPTPAPPAGGQPAYPTLPAQPGPAEPLPTREEQIRRDIQHDARYLFQSLLIGDVRTAANELFYPFQLEDKRYATPEELVMAWVKQLRLKRTDLVTLYDVEVMRLEELEKKYGKAPARLGLDLRNQKDLWAAVGNLSGRPGIFLFRLYGEEYRAFAYTD